MLAQAAIALGLSMALNLFLSSNLNYGDFDEKQQGKIYLNDIVHSNIDKKHIPLFETMGNGLMYICIGGSAVNLYYSKRFDRSKLVQAMLLGAIAYTIRAFSFSSTLMPHPERLPGENKCVKHNRVKLSFNEFGGAVQNCVDLMFSGHTFSTVYMATLSLLLGQNKAAGIVIMSLASTMLVVMPASRMHYTSDVIIGFFIAVLSALIVAS